MGQKCRGHKPDGSPCGQWARRGGVVCNHHGGKAKQVRAAAERRVVEDQARVTFGRLADVSTPVTDPLTALFELAGHVNAWMKFLASRIEDLDHLSHDSVAGEQIEGEIQLWERALDRCNTVFGTAARLNIDQRLAAITQEQHAMVLRAVEAALDAAGVAPERRGPAKKAAAGHLRLVEAG
jgi:hypothetical protein